VKLTQSAFGETNPTAPRRRAASALLICIVAIAAGFLLSACVSPDAGVATAQSPAAAEPIPEEDDQMQFIGVWDGSLTVPGAEIQITVKFLTNPTATDDRPEIAATMDIPAQLAYELPLSNVTASGTLPGETVHFELVTSGPTLIADGEINADLTISGQFTQGAASGGFGLSRVADLSDTALPPATQASAGTESEVSIRSDGVAINGALLLPTGVTDSDSSPVPLVIIVPGSGPTDRNGNTPLIPGRNDSLKLLAEGLASHGIASLRYDKRGIAGSVYEGFKEEDLTFGDLVNDLLGWVLWADARNDISGVFLAGHS
jgi:uncharacterized protein